MTSDVIGGRSMKDTKDTKKRHGNKGQLDEITGS